MYLKGKPAILSGFCITFMVSNQNVNIMNKGTIEFLKTTNDISKLNLFTQLDFFLDYFIERPDNETNSKSVLPNYFIISNYINSLSENRFTSTEPNLIQNILIVLNQLQEDGYIKEYRYELDDIKMASGYTITFKGRLFYQEGKYTGKFNKENEGKDKTAKSDRQAKANQMAILLLTYVVSCGTTIPAVYYCLEIRQHHYGFYRKTFLIDLILIVVSVLIAIILIAYSYKMIMRKEDK